MLAYALLPEMGLLVCTGAFPISVVLALLYLINTKFEIDNSNFDIHYSTLKSSAAPFKPWNIYRRKIHHLQFFEDELRAECVSLLPTAHRLP